MSAPDDPSDPHERETTPKLTIAAPFGSVSLGPDEETHVPCPVCRHGLVPATTAVDVRLVLSAAGLEIAGVNPG